MDHTRKEAGMDAVRRCSMLIGADWVDADDRFEIRNPATYPLLLSTPPA